MAIESVKSWVRGVFKGQKPQGSSLPQPTTYDGQNDTEKWEKPVPEDYPTFPPPPPQDILKDPKGYFAAVQARKYDAPQGCFEDTPLFVLYRLYEVFVVDQVNPYRNALESWWRSTPWLIHDIPDPRDDDPVRYAFLAGVTYLMVASFNARIAMGLYRGSRAIMSMEEAEEAKRRPESERPYEKVPAWAESVPPLAEMLSIPTHDGVYLDGKDDKRAEPNFLGKNILVWTPHIHFT